MRPIAFILLLLGSTSRTHAVPVTAYALGQVTENRSFDSSPPGFRPYIFTPGEPLYLAVTYDLDSPIIRPGHTARISAQLATRDGFSSSFSSSIASLSQGSESAAGVSLYLEGAGWSFRAFIPAAVGTPGGRVEYDYDPGISVEAVQGTLTRLAGPIDIQTVPEPSTFALAGTACVFGLGYAWRRRRRVAA